MAAPLDPTLGIGLASLNDFATEYMFIDMMKMSRRWNNGAWTYELLKADGHVDAGGNLVSYPSGITSIGTNWTFEAGGVPAGRYVLTWTGTATMVLTGDRTVISTDTASATRRIEFDKTTGGVFGLNVNSLDTGNPPQNIRVFRKEHEALLGLGVKFNPDWIALFGAVRQIRFKDWMLADSAGGIVDWADRPLSTELQWTPYGDTSSTSMGGVSVEVMVELANLIGADPWFCFPYKASDDYITQFVTYVEANLNSGLQATFEYGNEPWNTAFTAQRLWNDAQAQAAWSSSGPTHYYQWNTYRATLMAGIVQTIYAGEYAARAKCVINVNVINPQLSTSFVAPAWLAADPGGYIDPRTVIDSCAVTSYFGTQYANDATRASDLLSRITSDGAEATYTWLANELLTNGALSMSVPFVAAQWQECLDYLDAYSIDLVMYEGGQHIEDSVYSSSGMSGAQQTTMTTFLQGFCRSAAMADLYQASWDAWALVGGGPYMQYVDVRQVTNAGTSWGALRNLQDTTPRASLLFALNDSEASWFGNGGGAQYVSQTIAAADGEAVAVGARGGVVTGATGHEIVNVAGAPTDYSLVRNGDGGYTQSKAGYTLVISGVEVINYTG